MLRRSVAPRGAVVALVKMPLAASVNRRGPREPLEREASASGAAAAVSPCAPKTRLELSQELWGEGYDTPYEDQYITDLLGKLRISKGQNVLDLGRGLGAPGRAIARKFGASVTSLLLRPEMVQSTVDINMRGGLMGMTRVAALNRPGFTLTAEDYHCVIACQALSAVENKTRMLEQVEALLAPGGSVWMFELVIPDDGGESGALDEWQRTEPHKLFLESAKSLIRRVEAQNLILMTNQNETARYQRSILAAWLRIVEMVKARKLRGGLDRQYMKVLLEEAERWGHVSALLKSGSLQIFCLQAMKSRLTT